MITISRLRFTLLFVSLATSVLRGQDAWKPATQVANFLFNLPDGWKKIDTQGGPTLIPKNLPKGGACFIGFMPSQPLRGTIRSEFNARWAEWQRQFKVSQAGEVSSERSKNGFDRLRIDARVYNPQFGYSEFVFAMAQVGNRAEGYYWINNTGYYSYRDSLEEFEHSLQFANNPAAPAPASAAAQGPGGGLHGLYVGYKMRGLIGLHTHFEYLAFFPNGNVIRYLPEEGLGNFDFRQAVKSSPQGMRYCAVMLSANGRVKPDAVLVNGKPERHPEGAYYIEWHDNGKRIRLSVGKDAADASSMRLRKETELNNGDATVPEIAANGHRSVAASVADYLEETELTKKPKTLAAYKTALTYFTESCHKLSMVTTA